MGERNAILLRVVRGMLASAWVSMTPRQLSKHALGLCLLAPVALFPDEMLCNSCPSGNSNSAQWSPALMCCFWLNLESPPLSYLGTAMALLDGVTAYDY